MSSASQALGPEKTSVPCVLLTGFDPFGGDAVNPSWLAVKALQHEQIGRHTVIAARLPTVFKDSVVELKRLLRLHRPALVIAVGQAGGRQAISLERIAINISDARIADNAGAQPLDVAVVATGPAAYFSTLPIKAMLLALQDAGIAAEISQTAGTFVCNHVFYALMHALKRGRNQGTRTRGGFIHVPWLAGQGEPSMALEDMVRALRLVTACALATSQDVQYGAGTLN